MVGAVVLLGAPPGHDDDGALLDDDRRRASVAALADSDGDAPVAIVQPKLPPLEAAEQALQNALKHGRASTAHIRVSVSDGTPTTLLVTADSTAPARDRVAGNVTAIINAWPDDVGGTWSLDADESGGSSSRATIGDDARSE